MKYEFTGEVNEHGLKRIRRISDGLVGGWIESEDNLSHYGDCFVYDNAQVFDDARVSGDAHVFGNARVFDDASVFGNARVFDDASVWRDACVFGNARVSGDALVPITPLVLTGVIPYTITATHVCATIGCTWRLKEDWLRDYERLAKGSGLLDEQVEQAAAMLRIYWGEAK